MTCRSHPRLMRLKMGVRRTIIIRHCAAGQPGVLSSTLYRRIREINVVLSSLGPLEGNARMLLERVCPSPDLTAPLSLQRKSRHFQRENALSLIASEAATRIESSIKD